MSASQAPTIVLQRVSVQARYNQHDVLVHAFDRARSRHLAYHWGTASRYDAALREAHRAAALLIEGKPA